MSQRPRLNLPLPGDQCRAASDYLFDHRRPNCAMIALLGGVDYRPGKCKSDPWYSASLYYPSVIWANDRIADFWAHETCIAIDRARYVEFSRHYRLSLHTQQAAIMAFIADWDVSVMRNPRKFIFVEQVKSRYYTQMRREVPLLNLSGEPPLLPVAA